MNGKDINKLQEKFIDILTYRVSGDIDKLVSLAKRRAEFLLDCKVEKMRQQLEICLEIKRKIKVPK